MARSSFKIWPTLRDAVIVFALQILGGVVADAATNGKDLDPSTALTIVYLTKFLFGGIGFAISGCLAVGNRWRHLAHVAGVVFGFGIGWAGVSVQHCVGVAALAFINMLIGGGISFMIKSDSRMGEPTSSTPPLVQPTSKSPLPPSNERTTNEQTQSKTGAIVAVLVVLVIVIVIVANSGNDSGSRSSNSTGPENPSGSSNPNYTRETSVSPPIPPTAKVTPAIQTQEEIQFNKDRSSAESGNATAQFSLGLRYSTQTTYFVVGSKDDSESAKWFSKAADQGFTNAQIEIGRAYYFGRGVVEDKNKAVNWFRKAAEQGSIQGELYLGLCYKYGDGVPMNADEAVKWLTQAANQNDASAQFELGCCYSEYGGIDYVKKNNVLAYKWLSLAKAHGKQGTIDGKMGMDALEYVSFYLSPEQKSEAQRLAADFVPENGNAQVSQADTAATSTANKFKKDKELAESGDVQAALRLGLHYKNGEGVPANADQAVKWLTQAANQNDATAQFELGCCYSEYGGINYVKKNNVIAYKWLSLAKAQGKQGTIDGKMGMDALEYVSFYLNPEQKNEAQKLAADFLPQNDNRK